MFRYLYGKRRHKSKTILCTVYGDAAFVEHFKYTSYQTVFTIHWDRE